MSLIILGDDLSRLDRPGIRQLLRSCALPHGSYRSMAEGEDDLRFVYCATVLAFILDETQLMEEMRQAIPTYLASCQSYDGGLSGQPRLESHGGFTFCAVATLAMLDRLSVLDRPDKLLDWCVACQTQGFHGRLNKMDDVCYSYWIGSVLKLLSAEDRMDRNKNRAFLLSHQGSLGGFCKNTDSPPGRSFVPPLLSTLTHTLTHTHAHMTVFYTLDLV